MTVSRGDVERVADLAALSVSDQELAKLTDQIGRILDYISQLGTVSAGPDARPYRPGPEVAPLRADRIGSVELQRPLEDIAPAFRDGFFLVPKLEVLGGNDGPEAGGGDS